MKKLGRFTKGEILEAEARFLDSQSLYKIGKNMRRSQYAIRGHLINLGLIELSNSESKFVFWFIGFLDIQWLNVIKVF